MNRCPHCNAAPDEPCQMAGYGCPVGPAPTAERLDGYVRSWLADPAVKAALHRPRHTSGTTGRTTS
jgi:hypothetical protein